MKLDVLYEDNHIIVVKKPIGILSQADSTNDMDMLTLIKDYIKDKYKKKGNVFLGLIHRLDRMVSGVMVFAKTSKAASRLSEQVRNHSFQKNYLTVVHGIPKEEETLIHYLLKDEKTNTVKVVNEGTKDAKRAELTYKKRETVKDLSLLEIDLKTGRPHQIRVQLQTIGHPLYGDAKYGNANERNPIALFAYKLAFDHPTTKERLTFKLETDDVFPFNLFSKSIE